MLEVNLPIKSRPYGKRIHPKHNPLYQFRNKLGLTQKELADALECSQGYIAKIERDDCQPSVHFIRTMYCRIRSFNRNKLIEFIDYFGNMPCNKSQGTL